MADLDLRALAAPIEALRPSVEAAYRRLDEKWTAIADQLRKLPIPCAVSYQIWENPSNPEQYLTLDWRKVNGTKRVCIVFHDNCPTPDKYLETEEVSAYDEWSAEQRVEMLAHVPAFFTAAAKQTEAFIKKISK